MIDDPRFADAVEAAVADIETRTDAEIVVVAVPRAARHADLGWRVGAVAAAATGLALELVPWAVTLPLFLAEVVLAGVIAGVLAARAPFGWRLVPAAARRQAVRQAAAAAFLDEAVHGTPNHTGVLVFLAGWEREVAVIADLGVEGRVPPGAWQPAVAAVHARDLDAFLAGLRALGDVLARHVPAVDDSDAFDLPNAPRIKP